MFRNLSIGKKITGLSLVLLSIMLAASVYSFVQTNRARNAMADMTGALVPLSLELNAIERTALEQSLMLERAMGKAPDEAAPQIARFRELNSVVDVHLNNAARHGCH